MSDAPSAAVIYLRVSTDRQATSGVGAEAQEAACRKLCDLRGWQVLAVEQDPGVSGMEEVAGRPGLQRALELVRSRPAGDVVMVVYKLDRLSRSQRIIWELCDPRGDYGLLLTAATQDFSTATPIGRAMMGMLGVFAELDWENIRERNIAMQKAARARGARLGAPKMWEMVDKNTGERRADPAKVELIRRVKGLYAGGGFTTKSLAEHLNGQGIPSPRGRRWHDSTVHAALKAELPEQ